MLSKNKQEREKTETERYVIGYDVPIIKFKNEHNNFDMAWANKVMIDENINGKTILIKHETTHNKLEGLGIGEKIDIILKYTSKERDTGQNFISEYEYKDMYLVDNYQTYNNSITDTVKIFSNVQDLINLERIIKREEQEQLKNTLYKIKRSGDSIAFNIKDLQLTTSEITNLFKELLKRKNNS